MSGVHLYKYLWVIISGWNPTMHMDEVYLLTIYHLHQETLSRLEITYLLHIQYMTYQASCSG